MYIFKQARDDHDSNLLLIFTAGGHVASIKVLTPAFFGVQTFCSTSHFLISPVYRLRLPAQCDTDVEANSSEIGKLLPSL